MMLGISYMMKEKKKCNMKKILALLLVVLLYSCNNTKAYRLKSILTNDINIHYLDSNYRIGDTVYITMDFKVIVP